MRSASRHALEPAAGRVRVRLDAAHVRQELRAHLAHEVEPVVQRHEPDRAHDEPQVDDSRPVRAPGCPGVASVTCTGPMRYLVARARMASSTRARRAAAAKRSSAGRWTAARRGSRGSSRSSPPPASRRAPPARGSCRDTCRDAPRAGRTSRGCPWPRGSASRSRSRASPRPGESGVARAADHVLAVAVGAHRRRWSRRGASAVPCTPSR